MEYKVGIGEDSHCFSKEKKTLFLGGVSIADTPGLSGNSDADPILHAVCNAFDVVAGAGSLSTYSDKMLAEGINNSSEYVAHVMGIAGSKGWKAQSASISVEAKKPRLEAYSLEMKSKISGLLGIAPDDVGLTFTSGEDLSDVGRGLGIRATAVLMFYKN